MTGLAPAPAAAREIVVSLTRGDGDGVRVADGVALTAGRVVGALVRGGLDGV